MDARLQTMVTRYCYWFWTFILSYTVGNSLMYILYYICVVDLQIKPNVTMSVTKYSIIHNYYYYIIKRSSRHTSAVNNNNITIFVNKYMHWIWLLCATLIIIDVHNDFYNSYLLRSKWKFSTGDILIYRYLYMILILIVIGHNFTRYLI